MSATPRIVRFQGEFVAALLQTGSRRNGFISHGLPEDALLIEAHVEVQYGTLVTTWLSEHWTEGSYGSTISIDEIAFSCPQCHDWPAEAVAGAP